MLKAKSNPVICALNLIPFSYSEPWSDNSHFFSCIMIVPPYYWNISINIKYAILQCATTTSVFFWPHYFQMLPYFSPFLYSTIPWKIVCTCCFQCILLTFFSWTHSSQTSAPTIILNLLYSRLSVLLKPSCNFSVLFLFAWLPASNTCSFSFLPLV